MRAGTVDSMSFLGHEVVSAPQRRVDSSGAAAGTIIVAISR
jgi:hypothetical protein